MDLRGKDSGAALLVALTAIVIVTALATSVVTIVLCTIRADRESSARDALRNAAESGAEYAIWKLRNEPEWRGDRAVPVPEGKCDISVKAGTGKSVEITSRAWRGDRTCALRVTVEEAGHHRYRVTSWESARD